MPPKIKTPISKKIRIGSETIEFSKDKVRFQKRLPKDIEALARTIHTSKNAFDQRRAFILIFNTIKWSKHQKILWDDVEDAMQDQDLEINPKTLTKTRQKMRSVGLIDKRDGYWQFSTNFARELIALAEMTAMLMMIPENPKEHKIEERKDWQALEFADAEAEGR